VTYAGLRSPYSDAEWRAIVAALGAERERRAKAGMPFPQADQVEVVRGVLRPLRTLGQLPLQGVAVG
jgi:hypothetical protein